MPGRGVGEAAALGILGGMKGFCIDSEKDLRAETVDGDSDRLLSLSLCRHYSLGVRERYGPEGLTSEVTLTAPEEFEDLKAEDTRFMLLTSLLGESPVLLSLKLRLRLRVSLEGV